MTARHTTPLKQCSHSLVNRSLWYPYLTCFQCLKPAIKHKEVIISNNMQKSVTFINRTKCAAYDHHVTLDCISQFVPNREHRVEFRHNKMPHSCFWLLFLGTRCRAGSQTRNWPLNISVYSSLSYLDPTGAKVKRQLDPNKRRHQGSQRCDLSHGWVIKSNHLFNTYHSM